VRHRLSEACTRSRPFPVSARVVPNVAECTALFRPTIFTRACRGSQPVMPRSLAAAPPKMAILSSSLRAWGRHDVIDRNAVPRERVVGADDHLANPGCGHEVTQPLGREHDRVEIESVSDVLKREPAALFRGSLR
jgi:hypothetical protein